MNLPEIFRRNSKTIQLEFWRREFKRVHIDVDDETALRLARVHMFMHPDLGAYATGKAALMAGLMMLEKKLEGEQ